MAASLGALAKFAGARVFMGTMMTMQNRWQFVGCASRIMMNITGCIQMAKLLLKKTLTGWANADDSSLETSKRYKLGEVYKAEIVKPRSRKTLGRYWVLCEMILDNSEVFRSKEQVSDYLKIRTGHSTSIMAQKTGEMFHLANSIDFDSLDEAEFADLWQRVCDVVVEDILPGITQSEIEYEMQKIVGLAA